MQKVLNLCIKSLKLFCNCNKYTKTNKVKTRIQFKQIIINIDKETNILLLSNNKDFKKQQYNF